MSNFHQSFGSRFPAVRFSRNCCGCSSVAILYTSTKRNTCIYRLARPLLLLQKDFPKLNWFPNTEEVTTPRKQSQRKRTGVLEQYLQYQTRQFRQMHPMRKFLLSTFEEWFCFSPYSASARVLVFPLSSPFFLCRSVSLCSAKQNLHPPYNATTTKTKNRNRNKNNDNNRTLCLSHSPICSRKNAPEIELHTTKQQQNQTHKSNYYYYYQKTRKKTEQTSKQKLYDFLCPKIFLSLSNFFRQETCGKPKFLDCKFWNPRKTSIEKKTLQ